MTAAPRRRKGEKSGGKREHTPGTPRALYIQPKGHERPPTPPPQRYVPPFPAADPAPVTEAPPPVVPTPAAPVFYRPTVDIYRSVPMVRKLAAKDGKPVDVPRLVRRFDEFPAVSYEDYLSARAPKPPKAPQKYYVETTESASATGMRWLADNIAGGVAIELNERSLAGESDNDVLDLLALHQSFTRHIAAVEPDAGKRKAHERRYLELCRYFDETPVRLLQHLRHEWPEWLGGREATA